MTRCLVGNEFRDEVRPTQPSTSHGFIQRKPDRRAWLVALEPGGNLRQLAQRLLAPRDAAWRRHDSGAIACSRACHLGCSIGVASGGANRLASLRHEFQQVPHPVGRGARRHLPFRRSTRSISFHDCKGLGDQLALRRPMRGARQARFLLDLFERQDAGVDPLGAPRRIGDAGQLDRRLVLPKAEGRAIRPAKQRHLPQRLHQCSVSALAGEPGHGGQPRISMSPSSGIGNRPSQCRSTSPPMTEAPAIRPRSPAVRTKRFCQPGRNFQILGSRLQRTDRQRGNRAPQRRQALVAALGLGLPFGIARLRHGRHEDGSRSKLARSPVEGRRRSADRRQGVPDIASKSAVSSSGIMVKPPAGLVGYDTSRAVDVEGPNDDGNVLFATLRAPTWCMVRLARRPPTGANWITRRLAAAVAGPAHGLPHAVRSSLFNRRVLR